MNDFLGLRLCVCCYRRASTSLLGLSWEEGTSVWKHLVYGGQRQREPCNMAPPSISSHLAPPHGIAELLPCALPFSFFSFASPCLVHLHHKRTLGGSGALRNEHAACVSAPLMQIRPSLPPRSIVSRLDFFQKLAARGRVSSMRVHKCALARWIFSARNAVQVLRD